MIASERLVGIGGGAMTEKNYREAVTLSLHDYAALVLGSAELGRAWLDQYSTVLGGTPSSIAATPEGELRVRSVLLKIEHGLSV